MDSHQGQEADHPKSSMDNKKYIIKCIFCIKLVNIMDFMGSNNEK